MAAAFNVTRLAYGEEALQFGDLYAPGGGGHYPVVILIHGGFWRAAYGLSLMTGLAEDLARRGIVAWNIEYRRVGDEGGMTQLLNFWAVVLLMYLSVMSLHHRTYIYH